MEVIEADALVKDYGRVRALDGLTLRIPGGTVGLLGPNGAGKSTFLKILLGFVRPTSGRARVLGLDSARRALEIRQQIGTMPEFECFIPGLNAVDTVYLAARLTGLPHTDALQRTHMVLNYVGLHEERYRDVGSYSTGMKQKVKFAQAIVHHPRLLLLDEPTTGLDPRARQEMLDLIRDIARARGIHVLLSTHLLHDVEAICDRVVILHRGRLAANEEIGRLLAGEGDAYEVRVEGDREGFVRALSRRGLQARPSGDEEDGFRIPAASGTRPILEAAAEAGVQLRRLQRARTRLEERFAELVGGA